MRLENFKTKNNIGRSSSDSTFDGVIIYKSLISSRLKSNLEFIWFKILIYCIIVNQNLFD